MLDARAPGARLKPLGHVIVCKPSHNLVPLSKCSACGNLIEAFVPDEEGPSPRSGKCRECGDKWSMVDKDKGILIPDTSKVLVITSEVVAIGTGDIDNHGNKREVQLGLLKVGDTVLHQAHAGMDAEIGGKLLKIMNGGDVLAIVELAARP